jgi:glyoxylase-like metal-dependent hydrolase (beta-lactamase superfamily II)
MVSRGEFCLFKIDKHVQVVDFQGFEYPHCNCLLIKDDINCLIDSSPGQADMDYLLEQPIDLIINSHGHIDHYLYNDRFPQSKVLMHQADQAMAQSADVYLENFGLKTLTQNPVLQRLYLEGVQYRSTRIDQNIEEGQIINLGSTRLQTLHLPGHSPGHCGFLFLDKGFIFSADIDFSNFGPWYANLNCSIPDFLESIDRILKMKPDYIISGHGEAMIKEGLSRRLVAYRDIIFARQERIVELLYRGHHSLADLARQRPIYIKFPRPKEVFFIYEQVMILVHLRYMQELGQVIQDDQGFYLKEGIHPTKAFQI